MIKKSGLGQFFTTNSNYIIGNLLEFLPSPPALITDPFAGNCDLLKELNSDYRISAFDIDPKSDVIISRDTLTNPPDYSNYWIVTNPPYLARNKNNVKTNLSKTKQVNKDLYDKFNLNDLYKIAIKTIMNSNGGIIILPLNFFCEEKSSIREEFLSKFNIVELNIFEETVFDDTSYTICSFFFKRSMVELEEQTISTTIWPSKKRMNIKCSKGSNFRFANEFYLMLEIKSNIVVSRLISGQVGNSNLKLRALDTGSMDGRIGLSIDNYYFDNTPNRTERAFCTLVFNHNFSMEEQELIAEEFNSVLESNREKYNSLFLTNFRNSTSSYARKRIGFDTAYKLVLFVIEQNRDRIKSLKEKE